MAFVSKVWKDIDAEYPSRYTLKYPDLTEIVVTILNNFGIITEEGDVFDAATMNNLEGRIDAAFDDVFETLTGTAVPTSGTGKDGDMYIQTQTENGVTTVIGMFVKISGAWLEISTGGAALPQAEGSGF